MNMKVNKNLALMKAYYFFFNGSTAPIAPFIPVIAKRIGYTTTSIGTLLTVIPLLTLVIKPALGALADKFRLHKTLFICLIALYSGCFFSLQWFSNAEIDSSVVLECGTSTRFAVGTNNYGTTDVCIKDRVLSEMNSSFTCELLCRADIPFRYDDESMQENGGLISMTGKMKYSPLQLQEAIMVDVISLTLSNGSTISTSCPKLQRISCETHCSNAELQKLINKPGFGENDGPKFAQFWIFGMLVVIGRLSTTNAMTIGDTLCMKLLGDRPEDYGRQRMFGAGGWGFMAMISGLLTDWYSQGKYNTDYSLCYYISITFCVVNLIIGFNLKYDNEEKPAFILANVKNALVKDPQFVLFLIVAIFCGAYSGLVWNFLFWFVEELASEDKCSDSNWLKSLEGIILFVHTFAGEIPFFIISGWMITRLGHIYCVSLVTFTFGLRFCLFYFIPNPWWLLPIEVLNGITYAIFNATSATYANKIAQPGTEATVQAIVASSFEGLGISLGTLLGGVIIDQWGGRLCFLMAGISSFILCLVYTIVQLGLSKGCSLNESKQSE